MHEMLTIITDVCSVSLSVTWRRHMRCTPCAVCAGLFGAVFAKCHWRLVIIISYCYFFLLKRYYLVTFNVINYVLYATFAVI